MKAQCHDENISKQILNIIRGTLPPALYGVKVVTNASAIISKEELTTYWRVFQGDKVFACFLPEILLHCALLLSTDDCLYTPLLVKCYLLTVPYNMMNQPNKFAA